MSEGVRTSEEKPLGTIQRENPESEELETKEWVSDVQVIADQ